MASFFGFGRRKEESDIPMSSSNHSQNPHPQTTETGTPRPGSPPPQGPPPTNPAFVPSPALSPPNSGQNSRSTVDPATVQDNVVMPNIHIFNPRATANNENADEINAINEQGQYGHDEQDYSHEDRQDEKFEDEEYVAQGEYENALQLKPSLDSYATTEEHPGDVHDNNNEQWKEEHQGGEIYGEGDNGEQEEFAAGGIEGYPQEGENLAVDAELAGNEPQSVASSNGPPAAKVASVNDEVQNRFQPEDTEEGDEADDLFPSPSHFPASTPLRESSFDPNGDLKPSPILSYSDDSRSTVSATPPSSANRFRTPIKQSSDVTFDTSSMVPPPKSPREEIFTPQFKEVHARTVRRRKNLQHHMQNLERRLASITSDLANITMDREAKQCQFLKSIVCEPMERASERIALEKEYQTSPAYTGTKNWMSLENRMSHLETDVTRHSHVAIPQTIRDSMDQPYVALNQEISPVILDETKKSEKREGNILRQFESLAATARRRYHEERAARFAAFELMRQRLVAEAKVESDPQRIEELISKVRVLRSMLEQERVERRMQDEHLKTSIEQEVISMKRALLEAAGGDDFSAELIADETTEVRRTIAYH